MANTYSGSESSTVNVPYIVHEGTIDRLDRTIKKLWILCIVLFVAFVITNGTWIYYEATVTTEATMIEQDVQSDEGDNNLINAVGGEINYGDTNKTEGSD